MTWMPAGYKDWFSVKVTEDDFQLKFNRRAHTLYQNFDEAADEAAKLLHSEWFDKPLFLALSGGVDSECVAETLRRNKILFTPIIVKITGVNDLETWYAEYWCYKNCITPVVLTYTPVEFAEQTVKFFPNLLQVKCHNLTAILIVYEYAKNNNGYGLYSGGDINFDLDRKEFFCASLDFISNLVDAGKNPTSFFMYTPELALSYVNQFVVFRDEQYNKLAFYNVSPRPKIQYLRNLWRNSDYHNYVKQFFPDIDLSPEWRSKYKFWYGTKEQIVQDLQP